jgi:hypothetical protein
MSCNTCQVRVYNSVVANVSKVTVTPYIILYEITLLHHSFVMDNSDRPER